MPVRLPIVVASIMCAVLPVLAQQNADGDINALRAKGYTVTVVSPIFSQLVAFSLPKGFKTVFEKTNGDRYIREAVLDGETADQWSQMITVTGAKGLAANPNVTAQSFVERIAGGFKGACPDTYGTRALGAAKFSGRDGFMTLAGCGTVGADGARHSESALLIGIKGAADYYTIQWAVRGAASNRPITFDDATWLERLRELAPIRICRIVANEAPPYPSCVNQK